MDFEGFKKLDRCRLWVTLGHLAMLVQYPLCPEADAARRFMGFAILGWNGYPRIYHQHVPSMPSTFEFCLPTSARSVPDHPVWLHEVKYDGYRLRLERVANASA